MQALQVKPNPIYQRSKPVRSKRYLAFVRKQASVVSGFGPCQACHTGPHGAGQKADDRLTIPLTWKEHERFDVDPRAFAELHRLDVANLIEQLNALFEAQGGIY